MRGVREIVAELAGAGLTPSQMGLVAELVWTAGQARTERVQSDSPGALRMRRWRERQAASASVTASVTVTPEQVQSEPPADDTQLSFSFDFAADLAAAPAIHLPTVLSLQAVTVTPASSSSLSKDLRTNREESKLEGERRAREPASRVTGGSRRRRTPDWRQREMSIPTVVGTPYPVDRKTPPEVLAVASKFGLSLDQTAISLAKCAAHYRRIESYQSNWNAVEELWLLREAQYLGVKPREPPPAKAADNWATERLRLEEARYRDGYYSDWPRSEMIEDLAERVRLIDCEGVDPDRALEIVQSRRRQIWAERDELAQGHRETALRQQNG